MNITQVKQITAFEIETKGKRWIASYLRVRADCWLKHYPYENGEKPWEAVYSKTAEELEAAFQEWLKEKGIDLASVEIQPSLNKVIV